jgi:hypothetical protein
MAKRNNERKVRVYSKDDEIQSVYERGFDRGFTTASWTNIPEIGTRLPRHVDWVGVGEIKDEQDQAEAMQALASDAESNDRDFSPFEFTAHEFNEAENSEELWEAFDEGINDGILANIESRL